ncbi:Flp pilus assembly protein CpaB [Croceicoccus sp. Ery15]|uniref:Flp pilus assembly protein CpaB n=1 Tax=Croceicoccus sp. Ery15 TaxID=1703338 RepID=UPI001E3F623C|nr:Flp pilus assembly protein CpaB [Croceicoccus sp. Ery15]
MIGRNWIFLLVAIGLGLIAVVLANSYFTGIENEQERLAKQDEVARIVVATQPMEFGTAITTENTRMQNFPANSVPTGAFFSIEELAQGGQVAIRPIVPGEPILADKLSGRAVLSANLPDGMRAISFPVNATTQVSGFVRPADIVDVLMTRGEGEDRIVEVIMESVQVLAVDQVASENATEPGVGGNVTVMVDQYDAQKLTLARQLGQLSLALRNVENQEPGPGVAVSARDIGSGYRAPVRAAYVDAPAGPAPRGPAAAAAPARPAGPTMSVVRGTEQSSYSIGQLGGS